MSPLFAVNLWSPHHGLSLGMVILTAFLLGVVHGVTPDEHTWPITFSYALGSFSARKGMRSALAFSLAFTAQRALLSELAYLGMLKITDNPTWSAVIYVVVGAVMALAAFYVLRLRCALHLHLWPPSIGGCHRPSHADSAEWAGRTPTPAMAAVHGFVAGWGLGAFALIMATVLAPQMPSAALGWVPGAAFGLGTTAVLVAAGAVIGSLIRHQRLPERLAQRVAQEGAGWTLLVGGVLFVTAGAAGLVVPSLMTAGISTGIDVHNLDQINIGTLLVVLVVVVAVVTITRTVHRLRHLPTDGPGPDGPSEPSPSAPPRHGPPAERSGKRARVAISRPRSGTDSAVAPPSRPAPPAGPRGDVRGLQTPVAPDGPTTPTGRSGLSRLVLLARPGAGKSTQAERLAAHFGVAHLATGALLRREVASSSALGRAIAPALEHGDLAPDELVAAVIGPGLEQGAASGGYVLDGFPRDLAQAEVLAAFASSGVAPQVAVSLEVSLEECRRRLLARAGVDARSDDTPDTIDLRLAAYERDMVPVLEFYERRGLIVPVDGEGSPERVMGRILERLGLR